MAQDEHPRPQTTVEQLAKLAPVFKKGGAVTAANASVSLRLRCWLLFGICGDLLTFYQSSERQTGAFKGVITCVS